MVTTSIPSVPAEPLSFWPVWTICSECIYIFIASLEGPKRSFQRHRVDCGYLRVLLTGTLSWHTFSADTPSSPGLDRAGDKVRSAMTGMWKSSAVIDSEGPRHPSSEHWGQSSARIEMHIMTFYALWKTTLKLITAGITGNTEGFFSFAWQPLIIAFSVTLHFMLRLRGNHCIFFSFLLHFFHPEPKKLMITSGRTGNRYSSKL